MSCEDTCVVMDYDDYNEFSRETFPRAAKPHKCCECGDMIAKGETHQYVTGKSDGEFWTARTCAPCVEIRKVFACDGYVFSMLWESMNEQVFGGWDEVKAIDCLAKLKTDAAIAKMRAMYAAFQDADA